MPKTTLPDRIRTFLAQPHPAVIASVRPDGQPVSVATWYLLEGDEVLVNMDAGRWRDDEGLVDIDRLSRHYRDVVYPTRDRPRVSAWVAVERWHGWGSLRG